MLSNRETNIFIVGNDIISYKGSQIFLIPPNLPHAFKDIDTYHRDSPEEHSSVIVYFRKEAFDKFLSEFPEMFVIQKFLIKAERVIRINGPTKKIIEKKLWQLPDMGDVQRILAIVEILDILSKSDDLNTIISESYVKHLGILNSNERIQNVHQHILENLHNSISLEKIASVAHMSRTGFCRYFKSVTGKTFSTYVNEIRINHACKLLIEGKSNIAQIGYDCGFHQPSYFNRIFKAFTHKTPLEFLTEFHELVVDKDHLSDSHFRKNVDSIHQTSRK
ncbi:helix-turn-helix domain-containing protein [bacterium]|nr:helix-turn-helix domain-containing protein [bacterium]